jgi:hypothetical protein
VLHASDDVLSPLTMIEWPAYPRDAKMAIPTTTARNPTEFWKPESLTLPTCNWLRAKCYWLWAECFSGAASADFDLSCSRYKMHAFPSDASIIEVMGRLEIAVCADETTERQQTNAQTEKSNHSGGENC